MACGRDAKPACTVAAGRAMSAVRVAESMSEPITHFSKLAGLERAAIGDDPRGGEALAIAEAARGAAGELRQRRPSLDPPPPRGWLARLLGPSDPEPEQSPLDRWYDEVDAAASTAEQRMAAWQGDVDAAWLAEVTADKDAAIAVLVDRGLLTPDVAARYCADPLGTLLVLDATSQD